MPPLSRQSPPFHVGAWCVDPATGVLTRGSDVRRARPLVAELLLCLAGRAGEVVTKEELVAGPWGGATIADSAVTSTIAELRELLNDQPKSRRYIETLPKRGYRLIAPVTFPEESRGRASAADANGLDAPVTAAALLPAIAAPAAPAPAASAAPDADSWRWTTRSWALAFGLGVAFAVAVIVSIASRHRSADAVPTTRAMRLTVDLPPGVRLAPDSVPRLALTADGSRMAYVVRSGTGLALYTRRLDQFEATPVTGTTDAVAPFFSPDGTYVGYFANGQIRTVPVSGGQPRIVCQARVALGATWTRSNTIIFSGTDGLGLYEVPAAGGEPRELTARDRTRVELSHRWPQVLPDGIHVLYTAVTSDGVDVLIFSRQTGEHHLVIANANAGMFVPPNRLIFERDGRVMVTAIDPQRYEGTGAPRVLVEDVSPAGPGAGNPLYAVGRRWRPALRAQRPARHRTRSRLGRSRRPRHLARRAAAVVHASAPVSGRTAHPDLAAHE